MAGPDVSALSPKYFSSEYSAAMHTQPYLPVY